jgi:hypothetical protein
MIRSWFSFPLCLIDLWGLALSCGPCNSPASNHGSAPPDVIGRAIENPRSAEMQPTDGILSDSLAAPPETLGVRNFPSWGVRIAYPRTVTVKAIEDKYRKLLYLQFDDTLGEPVVEGRIYGVLRPFIWEMEDDSRGARSQSDTLKNLALCEPEMSYRPAIGEVMGTGKMSIDSLREGETQKGLRWIASYFSYVYVPDEGPEEDPWQQEPVWFVGVGKTSGTGAVALRRAPAYSRDSVMQRKVFDIVLNHIDRY